ncbi:hypothetical protein Micbo1qcDRAFT_232424 [Microdochium bolleyi]|uniref:Uncharacterized protein n=1 Tax=Microdochium bolleyi TaxID=196109 RepID=A0A136J682_9PEZI|nr:hypothetical protein Micbo1qcDRAFT_232424 [Microdochium bolleyi]
MSSLTSSSAPMPVVICGAHEAIGQVVIAGLKPEYEVILFCVGAKALAEELPLLLSSPGTFAPISSTIGSGNFSADRPPRAVCFGGLWGPEDIALVQAALHQQQQQQAQPIPPDVLGQLALLRNNPDRQPPTEGPGAVVLGSPAYSAQIIQRLRRELAKLAAAPGAEGKAQLEGAGTEGVYWY